MSRLGISPLAHQLAKRGLEGRMSYALRIERVPADGEFDDITGLVAGPLNREIVYEGIGGIYVKSTGTTSLDSTTGFTTTSTRAIIPRSDFKPRVDDLLILVEVPAFAEFELEQIFTVTGVDGGGRLGPIWNMEVVGLDESSTWHDESQPQPNLPLTGNL